MSDRLQRYHPHIVSQSQFIIAALTTLLNQEGPKVLMFFNFREHGSYELTVTYLQEDARSITLQVPFTSLAVIC